MENASTSGNTAKVRMASYWTERRKIRAAVADFFSPENDPCLEIDREQAAENINTQNVNDESNLVDSDSNDDSFLFDDDFESECWLDDVESREPQQSAADEELVGILIEWVSQFNIPLVAVTALLHGLQRFHPNLPSDARTLLHTPRTFNIKQMTGGGEYIHFGIRKGVEKLQNEGFLVDIDTLELQFSIDGIALYKSSNTTLWPILCAVKNCGCVEPFVIGIFCGKSKPASVQEFLHDFVQEMSVLMTDGIELNDSQFAVTVHSFVCDTPARAMVKNIKGPTGYFGCDKCETHGEWNGKVTFVEADAQRRTDVRFDELANEDHHLGSSALQSLPIGMVSQFPLDYMHLVCLGVMRRLILCWLKGPLNTRLCARKVMQLSEKLTAIAAYVPKEFCRKPRSVTEILRWKATEFRQFVLYTGPVVLLHILPEMLYSHFLLLSVAVSLLANPQLCSLYSVYANDLLRTFVNNAAVLYGTEMMVYNVHALLHLADDVHRFGRLDNFAAFPFENALMGLKKLIRKPNHILQQIASRLSEQTGRKHQKVSNVSTFFGRKEHSMGPLPSNVLNAKQYTDLQTANYHLSVRPGDNCVAAEDGKPCLIRNIVCSESKFLLLVEYFSVTEDFFTYPLPSSTLHIFAVRQLLGSYRTLPADLVAHKFVCLPNDKDGSFIVLPLNHVQ